MCAIIIPIKQVGIVENGLRKGDNNMKVYGSVTELIGNTPLVELKNYEKKHDLKATILAKLEYFNPAGSVKDRIAKATEGSFIPGQFVNPANPKAHFTTTGPEIWNDTDGKVDIFVAGIGTGGTVSGIGGFLKSKNPSIKVVGLEPAGSPFLSKGITGPHKLQGIGAGFKPDTLNTSILDEIITIENDDAFAAGKAIARTEGILVGITSGAAVHAATILAQRPENAGKVIVALLPDTGDRYLSTPLFSE